MRPTTMIRNGKTYTLRMNSAVLEFTDTERQAILNYKPITLNAQVNDDGLIRLPRSTLLIGDKLYNNVWHPAEELEKSYKTLDHQPLVIDHSDHIEDEIGWMENSQYDPASKKLTAIPVLNTRTAKGLMALNHIQNRLHASKAPETSVGFWAIESTEEIPMLQNARKTTAREWEFDHDAMVYRGAGSPSQGIGIGLSQSNPIVTAETPVIPPVIVTDNRSMGTVVIIINAEWDTAYINSLPDPCFAYIEPGGSKDEEGKTTPRSLRHFPYKDKDGKIDLPHLRNALARASQSPFGDKALPKLKAAAKEAGVGEEAKKSD